MKFSPCTGQCTEDGSHCQSCGRAHEEIAEMRQLVGALVKFAQEKDYENHGDFAAAVGHSIIYKLQNA